VDPDLVNEGARSDVILSSERLFRGKSQSQIQKQPIRSNRLYQIVKGPRGKVDAVSFTAMNIFLTKT